jgi:predicted MFS family arabinose efflux permease
MTLIFPRAKPALLILVCVVGLGGCSDLSRTQQRTLTGGAIGTTVGAISTAVTGGCVACGAAIGGAVGAGSGYLYDYLSDKETW